MIADMKNQEFLNKALRLLPTLKETKVEVAQTVEVYKEDSEIKSKNGNIFGQTIE